MKVITLDASSWREPMDFIDAMLPAIGAPDWHGDNLNALLESMIWCRDINALAPPYRIVVRGTADLPEKVMEVMVTLRQYLALDRQENLDQNGEDVEVSLDVVS